MIPDEIRLDRCLAVIGQQVLQLHPRIERALCQGAALHYINGKNGVKDFDVWSFYAQDDRGWQGARRVLGSPHGPAAVPGRYQP